MLLRPAQPQRVRAARQQAGGQQAGDVADASPGRRRCGPPAVSTSTIGSSQNSPREPVRTTVDIAGLRQQRGHRIGAQRQRGGIARDEDPRGHRARLQRRVDPRGVEPPERRAIQHAPTGRSRTGRGRTPAPASPRRPAWCRASPRRAAAHVSGQRVGAQRLAGLGAAQPQHVPARRVAAEVVIEADDPCTSARVRFSASAIIGTASAWT